MEVEIKMMKNFKRSTKGLSPIFATLILIAIAVIAGIVVYMFSSGYIGQLTGGGPAVQEKAAVQGVDVAADQIWASYVAGPEDIDITGVIVRDAGGNTVLAGTPTAAASLDKETGALTPVGFDLVGGAGGMTSGDTYTVTLTSAKGGSFVSASFVCP